MGYFILGALIGAIVGHVYGWAHAHQAVASECEILGGFYVGDRVFRCERIKQEDGQ